MMRNVGGATPEMRGLGNQKFVQVAVGRQHTLALNGTGMVLACGSNDFGQCGSEHPGDQPASANFEMGMLRALQFGIICKAIPTAGPPPPPRPLRIVQIAAGSHHSCAVSMGGVLLTWGSGTYGKLGHGDERDRHIPTIVEGHPATPVPAFAAVSAGAQHTIALSDRGELYSWGRNTEGQCGIARQKESETLGWRAEALAESRPRRVVEFFEQPRWYHPQGAAPYGKYGEPLQEKIVLTQISAGHNHSAALASDGSVFMFGRGNKGQVGRIALAPLDGLQGLQGRYDSPVPIRVGGALRGVKVVEVACGGEHTLARTATGHTYAWGAGLHGQLGLGRFALMVTEPTLIEAEVLDPGVAEVRRGVEAQGDTLATLDLAGSGLRRIVSTVRRVEESFIAYAVVACLAVFLPVALGVPWGGNAEARVYLGEYLGWN
jgi:alpha-tubulin suppressor-like RCC1 family protein